MGDVDHITEENNLASGDTISWYTYVSDNTISYNVKLTAQVAAAGGFAASARGALPPWPWHYRDMRHINGVTATFDSKRLPIASVGNGKFTSASGTWTTYGVSATVTGAEGERRPSTHLR
jgi:hypothetical protein